MNSQASINHLTLIVGGTGKTGRRVAHRMTALGRDIRIASRSTTPSFDWSNEATWATCLQGVKGVYLTYTPDLAMPGAPDAIRSFVGYAKRAGVERIVLLSGRGEPEAQVCEGIVQHSGLQWTIVRASWFNQNFSEGAFTDMVLRNEITLPARDQVEPFIDVGDIADVAVAALTEEGHHGEVYEVTGPRLMSFADIASDLSEATGRDIRYIDIPHETFVSSVAESGAPSDVVWILDYLFATVLDGRNAHLNDGVQRAMGREPKDFTEYAREIAATGLWGQPDTMDSKRDVRHES